MRRSRINPLSRFFARLSVSLAALAFASAGAVGGTGVTPVALAAEPAALSARPFDLKQVRLLEGPFKDALERDRKYLDELESDRLLYTFRVNAGLPAPGEPLGGWEALEVRGHTMGHYLSACAMMVASTGDEELKAKADAIVAELAKCQEALGPSGYLSAFPESFIDRVERFEAVWAPYYVLHKIMAGLVDMHVHCGNRQALEIAEGMAAWCKSRCDKLSDEHVQNMLNRTEQGGMNDVLAGLFALTGNPDHLGLSRRFVQKSYNDPLAAGRDELKGQHVNSFVPNIIGTARQYEVAGDAVDRRIATFFWEQVTSARCYSTGGTSFHEHWQSDPNKLADQLGDQTQETCCTYNMLKLTRHLFTWDPEAKYADYYERTLFNSILATQDPKTGMMMYFVPLASGYWKYFNTPRDSFWCCTGTGMENHAKYGDSIYFYDDDGLWVNLFIPSELDWSEKGVRIRQETKFPEEQRTALVVQAEKPVRLAIRVRVPGWAAAGVTVLLNGKPLEVEAKPGSYLAVDRRWCDGERLEIELPMSLWAWPMPDDPTLLSVMYGPLVLAGKLGGEGLSDEMVYSKSHNYQGEVFRDRKIAEAPVILTENADPKAWVEPVADEPLTFRSVGVGRPHDVTLVPYHRLWGERYAVYWRVLPEREWLTREAERKAREAAEAARREEIEARLVDRVEIGKDDSEGAHNYRGHLSRSGPHLDRRWRDATPDGWFEYEMKVLPEEPMALLSSYWGSDRGRVFDVVVDDVTVATETLENQHPQEFFDVEYPIPADLTRGKEKVTVKFVGQPGRMAGGVFGLATLKGRKQDSR